MRPSLLNQGGRLQMHIFPSIEILLLSLNDRHSFWHPIREKNLLWMRGSGCSIGTFSNSVLHPRWSEPWRESGSRLSIVFLSSSLLLDQPLDSFHHEVHFLFHLIHLRFQGI